MDDHGWKKVQLRESAEFVAMRISDPILHVNGRKLHCGDYIVMMPGLGHHWYMSARQFAEHFTLEGSDGR
jgi:hypothetical protein